ncbi:MAG: imidazole glycerol phosphate synthase subunit HisH [Thermomicrobiales bacterium]|jgi:glutamine amidotransferase
MIAVVDYGAGNLRSIRRALEAAGAETLITSDPDTVRRSDAAVLPGVGNASHCMRRIKELGLDSAMRDIVVAGKPFFGICVGMQLLFEHQEEGDSDGLGFLPGRVRSLHGAVKIPHMGWSISRNIRSSPIGDEGDTRYFYFVHSYVTEPDDANDVVAVATYGSEFPSVVARDNIWGAQFHPEKSGPDGLTFVAAFVNKLVPAVTR